MNLYYSNHKRAIVVLWIIFWWVLHDDLCLYFSMSYVLFKLLLFIRNKDIIRWVRYLFFGFSFFCCRNNRYMPPIFLITYPRSETPSIDSWPSPVTYFRYFRQCDAIGYPWLTIWAYANPYYRGQTCLEIAINRGKHSTDEDTTCLHGCSCNCLLL